MKEFKITTLIKEYRLDELSDDDRALVEAE